LIQWILEEDQQLQIVGLAADGEEGVRKAQELKPDLILLDIGLPKLNGIEAAKQILASLSQCRILVVTHDSSAECVRESLGIGARGYVLKERLVPDLLRAVKSVLGGKRFTSSGLAMDCSPAVDDRQSLPECTDSRTTSLRRQTAVQLTGRHNLQVHSSEDILLQGATCFVGNAIRAGQAAIVIATAALRARLLPSLLATGIEIKAALREGKHIALDVKEVVSLFMPNGTLDVVRFMEFMGGLIRAAARASHCRRPRVAVFAEYTSRLWAAGETRGAMRVEQLWNQLAARQDVDILCAYDVTNFHGDEDCEHIRDLCQEHSFVLSR